MFNISRFKDIERREYECEVVTPLFLGGADPQKAELRSAPIKGALRFWWRALNPMPINHLKAKESFLFGDADEEYGKSRITIMVSEKHIKPGEYKPLPHHDNKPKNFTVKCFLPTSTFKLDIKGAENHHNLFKLFSIIGGIGKRARRGFGSIRIISIDGKLFDFNHELLNICEFLNRVRPEGYEINKNSIQSKITDSLDYAYVKKIVLGKPQNNFEDLLKNIGQTSHDFNSDYTGYARRQDRFASPVFVSINRNSNEYLPIISILNTAFKVSHGHGQDKSEEFIKAIQTGGAK